jgi:methanogenic corrinoid protein MtbC1
MNEIKPILFVQLVADLQEEAVLKFVRERLTAGDDPLEIIKDCQHGMRLVGERYEQRVYYLSGLIMAGEIFSQVMDIVQPALTQTLKGDNRGLMLLGTVQGDIHDIGKDHAAMLLSCYGFSVHDLGVDVNPADFLTESELLRPDILGLSGLLTSSYDAMRNTVQLIRGSQVSGVASTPIIIGGSQLNEQVCEYVGADFWVTDAMQGVNICRQIIQKGGYS